MSVSASMSGGVGHEGVGPVLAADLDGELQPEAIVDEGRRDPHLEIPAGLEIGHPEVEADPAVGPADGFGTGGIRGVHPVPDGQLVAAVGVERDVEDPHLRARPGSEVHGPEVAGIEVLAVEAHPFDRLAEVQGRMTGLISGREDDVRFSDRFSGGGVEAQRGPDVLHIGRDDPAAIDDDGRRSERLGHRASLADLGAVASPDSLRLY